MIWRRLLVCDDSTIADLHYIIQIAMGWSDDHLHQFRIHGKRYGIYRIGGISFSDDPNTVRLKDLGLRIKERFLYEYDFTDDWQHLIRVEDILAAIRGPRGAAVGDAEVARVVAQVFEEIDHGSAQTSEARNLRDLVQELADPPKSAGEP